MNTKIEHSFNNFNFIQEYDNEAEKLVAQLNFTPEDDDVDIGLKLALVDMYSKQSKFMLHFTCTFCFITK